MILVLKIYFSQNIFRQKPDLFKSPWFHGYRDLIIKKNALLNDIENTQKVVILILKNLNLIKKKDPKNNSYRNLIFELKQGNVIYGYKAYV